ncbi:phospholipid/cholesterol/gamma-HCH transport system permease protein [Haloechinothrix alba]|uniref:Phospholipid/cholesterol/gamma-HCH transport system permease protein n=1 Tax=Haloechinothrix alba TaxID=664784 RepID=A0A238ZFB4_9PSEU|nr:ABC transporter permease [Haloechinothrix alba]SNR82166.1 phospholipid/cholesterol/gamma-HCH transport system permease protein [Haloechinothrix alba]
MTSAADTGEQQGDEQPASPARQRTTRWMGSVAVPIAEAGAMAIFSGKTIWSALRYPLGYWGEVRDQIFLTIKLCWFPLIVSTTVFGLGAGGIQAGHLTTLFGVPERLGGLAVLGSIREFAPWINAMVIAGVMGTAITADLGARRIREELDAMQVLGVDPIRTLVVPRVVAMTIVTALFNLVALVFGVIGIFIGAVAISGASSAGFYSQFFANATTTDVWASVAKTAIFGLIVGLVCCYKGYLAGGGPIGVGRAVNQAVVIAFAAIWIFNAVFTTILLGLNPHMMVFK